MTLSSAFSTLGLALLLGLLPPTALAGAGHDHGEAPAAAAGTALPRFAATSDLFELVGVLDGQKIALYLDHAGDNSPVKDARLELDIAGTNVPVTRVAEGEFQATLAAPLVLPRSAKPVTWWARFAINSAAGLATLVAGLWYFGHDGKMATYAALVLAVATAQWLTARAWRS